MTYRYTPRPRSFNVVRDNEAKILKEARTYRRIVRDPTPGAWMPELRLARAADAYLMGQASRHWARYISQGAAESLAFSRRLKRRREWLRRNAAG